MPKISTNNITIYMTYLLRYVSSFPVTVGELRKLAEKRNFTRLARHLGELPQTDTYQSAQEALERCVRIPQPENKKDNRDSIRIARVYDEPAKKDEYRILVDRLWPRGLSKEEAAVDLWLKDIAPSPLLRIWFGHDPKKFHEFRQRYTDELSRNPAVPTLLSELNAHKNSVLLYAAKNTAVNHAIVLQRFIETL